MLLLKSQDDDNEFARKPQILAVAVFFAIVYSRLWKIRQLSACNYADTHSPAFASVFTEIAVRVIEDTCIED